MYLIKFSKQAEKDKQRLKAAGLEQKAKDLLNIASGCCKDVKNINEFISFFP